MAAPSPAPDHTAGPLRVAIDATPLLGPTTGVGAFVRGLLTALAAPTAPTAPSPGVSLIGYGLTWNGRHALPTLLPPGVAAGRHLPMPATALLRVWSRTDLPPIEWWTGPVDAVHGTNFVAPPARHAGQVVTVHDLTAVHYPELCSPASLRYPALVRRALRRGALVHTHTEFVAREVVEVFGADPRRVRAVPPGVDMPANRPVHSTAAGPPTIVAIGSIEPRKDFPTLVRAFDRVASKEADVRLVIAGQDAWGAGALDAAMAASPFRARIDRMGWVSDAQRAELLRCATVLAFPSLYEGFGLPPLEAMAAGVPVVATASGSIPEVVGDGAVLVPARDPDALADALLAVLSGTDDRVARIARGRARAARYTWERCAAGLLTIYREAAAR